MRYEYTPGLTRALARAGAWASDAAQTEILSGHLLRALLEDEEASPSMLMVKAGITRRVLVSLFCPLPLPKDAAEKLPLSQGVREILTDAQRLAFERSEEATLASDHVLLAILQRDKNLRDGLVNLGLKFERLQQSIAPPPRVIAVNELLGDHLRDELDEPEESGKPPAEPQKKSHAELVKKSQAEPVKKPHAVPPRKPHAEPAKKPAATENIDAARILDASANRAREALRVLEDHCRFVLEDAFLSGRLKQLRHDLVGLLGQLPEQLLLQARDTLHDVGTTLSTDQERADVAQGRCPGQRRPLAGGPAHPGGIRQDLQSRARRRLREDSLSKLHPAAVPDVGRRCPPAAGRRPALRAGHRGTVPGRATADGDGRRRRGRSDHPTKGEGAVRRQPAQPGQGPPPCHSGRRALFIVNDRPDIARLSDADGVHLGQEDMPIQEARRIVGPDALIGVSTHNIEQVRQAVLEGASYIGVGPTFPSQTKTFAEFPGIDFVREALAETSLPIFALGGVNVDNVPLLLKAGCRRVAVSQAVCAAEKPRQAARDLRDLLDD